MPIDYNEFAAYLVQCAKNENQKLDKFLKNADFSSLAREYKAERERIAAEQKAEQERLAAEAKAKTKAEAEVALAKAREEARLAAEPETRAKTMPLLQKGEAAEKAGRYAEALAYYYQACAFEYPLPEAVAKRDALSRTIRSGSLPGAPAGGGAAGDIVLRKAWVSLIDETGNFFASYPLAELVYNPILIEGAVDYQRETVQMSLDFGFDMTSVLPVVRGVLGDVNAGLARTGKAKDWGLSVDRVKLAPIFERQYDFSIEILNSAGKSVAKLERVRFTPAAPPEPPNQSGYSTRKDVNILDRIARNSGRTPSSGNMDGLTSSFLDGQMQRTFGSGSSGGGSGDVGLGYMANSGTFFLGGAHIKSYKTDGSVTTAALRTTFSVPAKDLSGRATAKIITVFEYTGVGNKRTLVASGADIMPVKRDASLKWDEKTPTLLGK